MIKNSLLLLILAFTSFPAISQTKIMSYNVRFANENDGENSWSFRKDYITNQLKFYEPPILGVQEAVLEQLEYFKERLPEYNYFGAGRDDGKDAGEFSAIFYDTGKFDVQEQGTFWLSETPDKVSVGWDAALPRVCTYGKFRDKKSGENFWVFNTHFDHIGEKARQESSKLILRKIEELNSDGLPVILMGDFNLEPKTESIRILASIMNDSKEVSTKVSFGPEGTFNAYEFCEPATRRIDYIFTSKYDIEVLKYGVLTDSKDLKYPSDHFPVLVEFQIRK